MARLTGTFAESAPVWRHPPIFMYHRLTTTTGSHPDSLAATRFRHELTVLRALGYRSLPPRALAKSLRRGDSLPPRSVAITFDDGYLDTLTVALPLLCKLGFSATCYVVVDAIGGTARWTHPAPLMDWAGVRTWLAAGMEIGSHTLTHPDLTMVGDAALQREVVLSKVRLEDRLGLPVRSFAHPYNLVDRRAIEAADKAGYADGVAGPEPSRTPYALARVNGGRGSWLQFGLRLFPAYPSLLRRYRALVSHRGEAGDAWRPARPT